MPSHPDAVAASSGRGSPASAWSPFRHRMFAAMWSAQFVSNIGSWMQTVAAQWLMLTLTGSAAYVALVQTAAGLPVVLFAIVAGTVGDLVDRRRFLLATQTFMLVAATALGALAIAGLVTPWVLLALVFAVGTGQALTSPTWQTLQPELVSPAERVQAISLGSVNQNLARAIGPAIGGALLAATSSGTVFLVNAASFAARVLAVLMTWHSTRAADALPREHVGEAIRAGGRYIAASPVLRVILARAGLFIVFASAIWALLPLIAQSTLHLGAGGYGLLLAYAHVTAVAAVALVFGGACWVLVLSVLNSMYQLSLPGWIKARGMSFYLMVFQGGGAVGSAIMGLIAERAGLSVALTIAAAGLALSPLAGLVWRFRSIPPGDPAARRRLARAGAGPRPDAGRPGAGRHPVPGAARTRRSADDRPAENEGQPPTHRRDLLAGLARRERPRQGARGVRRRFLGRPPPPARARDQARTGASGARPRADRPGPPRRRHPLAGRQLAQGTRISGQADVTAAAS